MARITFKLPDIGEGIAAAEVTAWHVKAGAVVREDEPLVDVMTDKATVEISAPFTARVIALHATPGETVPVGAELIVFETDQEAAVATTESAVAASPPAPPPPASPARAPALAETAAGPAGVSAPAAPEPVPAPMARRAPGSRPLASPAVRRRAYEAGVPLQFVAGTGPEGRITHADLDRTLAGGETERPASAPQDAVEEVPVIGLRRRIAERMQDTKRRIPHFSYIEEVDVTALEDLRKSLNERHGKARPRLTLLPFLVRALAKALPDFPGLNARYDDAAGLVRQHSALHVGIATQTPAGLVVPVLRHAGALDLWACAAGIAALADAAREGRIARDDLSGSTLTITSLGALGGLATTPVINAPEVAIVGVNKISVRPVYMEGAGGGFVPRKIMNLSSSFDHRVVDGVVAAEFVQRLRHLLEQPATLFVE
ncbi:dihydrolipoamide acetyltransferase family protein [Xanthobacter sp. KR7-65]|uniref:dihydrolipoamide acetyltransferase family protein n=1 Tax=Xanthobacter sp. KR7-65 TaxID=3156612 RepID=UPI0032B3393D